MSISGLLVACIVLAILAPWIAAPFVRRPSDQNQQALAQQERERLLVLYERVLTNLRDLEEDHATGKIQTGEFEGEREVWTQRGIDVLKALDNLNSPRPAAPAPTNDDAIEAAIQAYREKQLKS
jgi:type II secretory pathway pseudopilin PulG